MAAYSAALTTLIGANERLCFYADVDKAGEKIGFYFAVQSGGSFDIDFDIKDPNEKLLLSGERERQGDYVLTANTIGEYAFCFENDISTLTGKLVDFDIMVESEPRREAPAKPGQISEQTSALEESVFRLNNMLMGIKRMQKHFHTNENRGFDVVKSTQNRIFWYAILQTTGVIGMAVTLPMNKLNMTTSKFPDAMEVPFEPPPDAEEVLLGELGEVAEVAGAAVKNWAPLTDGPGPADADAPMPTKEPSPCYVALNQQEDDVSQERIAYTRRTSERFGVGYESAERKISRTRISRLKIMSTIDSSMETEKKSILHEILSPQDPLCQPTLTTGHVDIVQLAMSLDDKAWVEARENALKTRAIKRLDRRDRNHRLAENACQLGDVFFDQQDYIRATASYFDATKLWPSNSQFYLKLTKAYLQGELFVDATRAATRALSLDPKLLEARYHRGVARLEQGLLQAAKIDFEVVTAHDPQHSLAHTSLGRTLVLLQATKVGDHILSPPPSNVTSDEEPVDFAFPRYDDDRLELAEPSDSSDCNHVGNGIPCRFYNHDGCARGSQCEYSHAPDEKSVRDDLGRNVCLYYLLSACKFGDIKCVYLHSKDALPTSYGWWNDPEQITKVKGVLELADRKAKEQRALDLRLQRNAANKTRAKGQGKSKGRRDNSNSKEGGGKGTPKSQKAAKPSASTVAPDMKDPEEDNGVANIGNVGDVSAPDASVAQGKAHDLVIKSTSGSKTPMLEVLAEVDTQKDTVQVTNPESDVEVTPEPISAPQTTENVSVTLSKPMTE
ncbi:hypothetical protein H0H93_014311 [Arthromyces matolae]|nr:hypothetical protein H0H93_014311 [Arthromyces matolae]